MVNKRGVLLLYSILFFWQQHVTHAQVASNIIPRIGVVDLNRIYNAVKNFDKSAKELERFKEASNNEILARKESIQALKEERLQALNSDNTELANSIGEEIKKQENDLKRFHQNAALEIRKIQRQVQSAPHLEQQEVVVNKVVSEIARLKGNTVILSANSGLLLYWTDKVDITSEIIEQLIQIL